MSNLVPVEIIAKKIYLIRGAKVILDRDLAQLYDVETRALKQAVKRNINRFPDDFAFFLNKNEIELMVSQ
ncbi:MAG: ORF6N domain-containing protein, partial [Elusimicrobiota bacterium]|nr:ORF6N domain-containing protein [Elusimicrobiota bacterium]